MPLGGWFALVVAAVLAVMWLHDHRVQRRGARLNDAAAMARGVTAPQANPEAHRAAMQPERWGGGLGGSS